MASELDVRQTVCWDEYVGPADALIGAGLIRRDQLPGQPGRAKVHSTFYQDAQIRRGTQPPKDEHYLSIQKRGTNRYRVIVGISEADADERYAKTLRAQEIAREEAELEEARIRQFFEMRALPKSHAEYRTQCAEKMRGILEIYRASFGPREWSGYSVDDETLVVFDSIAEQLVELLEGAGTAYSEERQQARIRAIQAMPVKANAPLQSFLRTLEAAKG